MDDPEHKTEDHAAEKTEAEKTAEQAGEHGAEDAHSQPGDGSVTGEPHTGVEGAGVEHNPEATSPDDEVIPPARIASTDPAAGHMAGSGPTTVERGLAGGDRDATAAQRRALGQVDVQPLMPRVVREGEAGSGLQVGDPGYAPPARIAAPGGVVLTSEHYDWDPGVGSANAAGVVPLAMPAPAYETVLNGASMARPSALTAGQATAQLHRMVGELSTWIMDNPHPVQGELAVVTKMFRDLSARRSQLSAASTLGRTVEPDSVDAAKAEAPPEFYELRNMSAHMLDLYNFFVDKMKAMNIGLTQDEQSQVDGMVRPFQSYMTGPGSADELTTDDLTHMDRVGPKSTANRTPVPRGTDLEQARVTGPEAIRGAAEGAGGIPRIAETNPQLRVLQGEPTQEEQSAA